MSQQNQTTNVPIEMPVPLDTSIPDTGASFQEEHDQALVAWSEPTSVEIIPGFQLAASMSFKERVKLLRMITEYTGAPSEKIDDYLNQAIPCTGVIMHPATVRSKKPAYDHESGEEFFPLISVYRIVFKRANSDKTLTFVSEAIKRFVETFLLPVFGPGPWEEPINIKFRQVATNNSGRTYQAQIVE